MLKPAEAQEGVRKRNGGRWALLVLLPPVVLLLWLLVGVNLRAGNYDLTSEWISIPHRRMEFPRFTRNVYQWTPGGSPVLVDRQTGLPVERGFWGSMDFGRYTFSVYGSQLKPRSRRDSLAPKP
jgi:hypothetical protein